VSHRFESAFGKQLGRGADKRVAPTFSFWSNCCCHE